MEINKIYNEDCLVTMGKMPDGFIDLTVTSPPYDNLRDYNGFSFEFEKVARELFRVTKIGGVVVWVVGDATINGSETGTSFKQALYFIGCGFNLHDTMIYEKNTSSFPSGEKSTRYTQIFEYMFVFSKGVPKTTNLIKDKKNVWAGTTGWGKSNKRNVDGTTVNVGLTNQKVRSMGVRNNICRYVCSGGFGQSDDVYKHPATFPEKLAADHIVSWSNKGDLVYDPFMGSGTTAKMAHTHQRNWIGSEISKEYTELAEKRIKPYLQIQQLF